MKYGIIIFILTLVSSIHGHSQSDSIVSNDKGSLYSPNRKDKVSLGVITGWHQFKYSMMEAGIGLASSYYGNYGSTFSAVSLSTELNPWNKIYGLKLSAWRTIAANPFFMFSLGLNGVYFKQLGLNDWTLRPMLGVGIVNFQLVYAYDLAIGKRSITERNSHMISLRFYIPAIKLNK